MFHLVFAFPLIMHLDLCIIQSLNKSVAMIVFCVMNALNPRLDADAVPNALLESAGRPALIACVF
jgi:hypothetical protein